MLTIHRTPPIVIEPIDIISLSATERALGGQSPSISITIDNARGQYTDLLSNAPLRHSATLSQANQTITGSVQAISLSATVIISLET